MTTGKRRVFPNPFDGRPAKIRLTRGFLLAPDVLLKLMGTSWGKLMKDAGAESILKTIEYHKKRNNDPPERLIYKMLEMIPHKDARDAFRQKIKPVSNENRGVDIWGVHGEWGAFLQGLWWGVPEDRRSYSSRYLLKTTEALRESARLFYAGNHVKVAHALYSNEITRVLVSPEMSFAMASVAPKQNSGFVQCALMLEAAIALLAAWYASMQENRDIEAKDDIMTLVADEEGRRFGLGRPFLTFLKNMLEQRSMNKLADHLSGCGVLLDIQTLKRWNTGKTMPKPSLVEDIAKCGLGENETRVMILYYGVRYLTLLGYITETFLKGISPHLDTPGVPELVAPWPMLPFGYESFHDWVIGRLPYWYGYHQSQLATGGTGPAAG